MTENRVMITSSKAPKPVAPYTHGVASGSFLFCSGQIGLDPKTGKLVSDDVREQTQQALENLSAVLKEAGCNTTHLLKVTLLLVDMADFPLVNEVYSKFLPSPYPARTAFSVSGLPLGARVEIEAIAHFS